MQWIHSSKTHIGLVRKANQDDLGTLAEQGIFIVADGMGGHAGGGIASQTAISSLLEYYKQAGNNSYSTASMAQAIHHAHQSVLTKSFQDPELYEMGTTLLVMHLQGQTALLGHVGDSRIYLYRNQKLVQLTRDHSLRQEQLDAKIITEEQAKNFPYKNIITRTIGISPTTRPDIQEIVLAKNDIFLLCTDGLHGELSDSKISSIMAQHPNDMNKLTNVLVESALESGGKDNVTVLCLLIS